MKEAEKGIRFVTTDGKEKFRVSDGEQIRIITGGDGTRDRTARYIDAGHMELSHEWGSTVYSIREFAERLEQTGGHGDPHAFHSAGQVLCCAAQQ